jgi:hypothetical protein
MRGAIAVGCVLLAGGCDAFLRLQSFKDPSDAPADVVGPTADGLDDDARLPSLCATPPTFTGAATAVLPATSMTEAALEDQAPPFVVFTQGTGLQYSDYLMQMAVFSGVVHPALTRDGTELFMRTLASPAHVYSAQYAGGFLAMTPESSLDNVVPGTAVQAGGHLQMVALVPASAEFIELTSDPGTAWTLVGSPMQPSDLGVDGSITSPSLSADGLVLAFVKTGGAMPAGVYFVRRPNVQAGFAMHSSAGVLLATSIAVATPWLTADCRTLYVVDTTSQRLTRYDQ